MRKDRIIQANIFDLFSEHEIGRELKTMSAWLDEHREAVAMVAGDVCRPGHADMVWGSPTQSLEGGRWARRSRLSGVKRAEPGLVPSVTSS